MTLQTARDRLEGYRAALREASVELDAELIVEGNFRQTSGYQLGKRLFLQHRRPSALFISNGMMAIGVIQALAETGLRCPADIALASFDDLPMTEVFHPHLTAVAQPAYQIGYRGAELLIQRVAHKVTSRRPVTIKLEPELKIRESTASRNRSSALFSDALPPASIRTARS
jgi:LacI family transcriptional regulator